MGQMKTPGVYIVEKNAFPSSVVEVATAVPAFIGYTQKADNKGKSLMNKPWRITSMNEFHEYFGYSPQPLFRIDEIKKKTTEKSKEEKISQDEENSQEEENSQVEENSQSDENSSEEAAFSLAGKQYQLKQTAGEYLLYYCMRLFFYNGGGPCYVISVGSYDDTIEADKLTKGIDLLIKEQEPTMVVIPETVLLKKENSISVQQEALKHCGGKMKNRIAILDIWDGYKERQDPSGDWINYFRDNLGINYLDYAVAYYPWVNTTIVQDSDLSYMNIDNANILQDLLREELNIPAVSNNSTPAKIAQQVEAINGIAKERPKDDSDENALSRMDMLNKSLNAMSPLFGSILGSIKGQLNLLPPAAAMAGIYTMVDNSRGVWKAPANVSLSAVVSPAVNISHDEQEDLNVTTQGKSINAIRTFIGEGTLVWGARTLDGNSLDWRYINVRRTMIFLEESIRLATKAYVFEPNVANTWVTIKSMIRNFLTSIWKRGGLAGATPEDAFSVHVGLGETMTSEDILEGILRVTVLVAVSRPAEFIEITFQQQMQKS